MEALLSLEHWLVAVALLLLVSIIASKASGRVGVPALLLFLIIGMLAGSEGIGGIWFNDAGTARKLGVVALAFILFAGGLETDWKFVRRSVWRATSLATIGVVVTSAIVGLFAWLYLHFGVVEALLLGAIVSSTDAAAVFSILRSTGVKIDEDIASTLELESGSNDPMAVFLTTALVGLLMKPETSPGSLILSFVEEMLFGAIAGIVIGRLAIRLLNGLKLQHDGLYPVVTIAIVLLAYGATVLIGGNGFLAVYLAGIVMGRHNFIQRRTLTRFHDGVAWLMQIAMFLALGLLVFPSQLVPVAAPSLALAFVLIFLARPVAVFLSLSFARLNIREKTLIAWVGLRGAVPIVLATFPLLAGVPKASQIFNIVFFIVLASVMLQGTTIPLVARWLKVDAANEADVSPSQHSLAARRESALVTVEAAAHVAGTRLVELAGWPREAIVLVLYRGDEFWVPSGSTELSEGDRLIVLTSKTSVDLVRTAVGPQPAGE